MRSLRLIGTFIRTSFEVDLAFRANFWIHLFNTVLNLAVGALAITVLFGRVSSLKGWDYPSAMALLGVYLTISALRALFIGPSLEALVGLGQEVWDGRFDFTLLRPVNTQFLITFRKWRLFALLDLALGLAVIVTALQFGPGLDGLRLAAFLLTLLASVVALYAVLLIFTALVFWSPGMLFTWVFDALFQLARYPVQIYPNWLQFVLTWLVPVGIMTTLPAQALTGQLAWTALAASLLMAGTLLAAASWLFNAGLRRYASASS
jgi:ABC-2 type transport system permease protein